MKKFQALIFDCDGVLVNSEEIVQSIEIELLGELGLHYERDAFARRFLGVANDHFYAELNGDSMQQRGEPLPQSFTDNLHQRAREAFEQELRAFAGIADVVKSCVGKIAVASSSTINGLEFKLSHTGIKQHFAPHIFSAEHVNAGKPAPDVYLHAADKIGASPEQCVVVEDSVNGVLAGIAAGMQVIGYVEGQHCLAGHDDLLRDAGANLIVGSMRALQSELVSLGLCR